MNACFRRNFSKAAPIPEARSVSGPQAAGRARSEHTAHALSWVLSPARCSLWRKKNMDFPFPGWRPHARHDAWPAVFGAGAGPCCEGRVSFQLTVWYEIRILTAEGPSRRWTCALVRWIGNIPQKDGCARGGVSTGARLLLVAEEGLLWAFPGLILPGLILPRHPSGWQQRAALSQVPACAEVPAAIHHGHRAKRDVLSRAQLKGRAGLSQ